MSGIYYSRIPQERFMWAFVSNTSAYTAHFGLAEDPCLTVKAAFMDTSFVHTKPEEAYIIMPEGMYKW